jgi:iron(III) transport system substrate-binding protein
MRSLIALIATIAFSCGTMAQTSDWKRDWDATLAAAKNEGTVVVAGSPDPVMRAQIIPRFQKAFGIQVEFIAASSGPFSARLRTERSAGIYSVDVHLAGSTSTVSILYPEKMLDPLKPLLVLPEVTEAKYWKRGAPWFIDPEKQYVLLLFSSVDSILAINTEFVKPGDLRKVDDLLDPKWRGKISAEDPTGTGSGNGSASHILIQRGPEFVQQLYLGQKVTYSRDRRQLADWMARGTYPICIGCRTDDMGKIKEEGFKVQEVFDLQGINNRINASPFVLSVAGKAPHPNAAKVFVNWMAGKEALETYSRDTSNSTLRTDVDESFLDPNVIPKKGRTYVDTTTFEWLSAGRPKASEEVRKLLKQK